MNASSYCLSPLRLHCFIPLPSSPLFSLSHTLLFLISFGFLLMLCPLLQIMWMDIALAPPPSPVQLGGPESRGALKVTPCPQGAWPTALPQGPVRRMHGGLFACVLPHRRCVLVLQLLYPFNPFTFFSPIPPLPHSPYACLTLIKGYKEEGMGFYCYVFWRCDFTGFSLILLFCFSTLLEILVITKALSCHIGSISLFHWAGAWPGDLWTSSSTARATFESQTMLLPTNKYGTSWSFFLVLKG